MRLTRNGVRAVVAGAPWYVLVVPAVLVWSTWFKSGISPDAGVRSMAIAIAAPAAMWLVLAAILHDPRRAGLIVLAVEALLMSKALFGLVAEIYARRGMVASVLMVTLLVAAAVVAGRLAWKARGRIGVARTHAFSNVLAISMLVIIGVQVAGSDRLPAIVAELADPPTPFVATVTGPASTDARPDIFLVLMDGYPRADVLEERLGHDNSSFLAALRERGFEVAGGSRTGYLWTALSLSSLFGMDYVERQPPFRAIQHGEVPVNPGIRHLLDASPGISELRERGYETVGLSSGYEQVAMRGVDTWVASAHITEFEVALLESTFVGDLLNLVDPDFASAGHRQRVVDSLAVLGDIAAAREGGPRFVFAHLPVPHQPAVFDRDGGAIRVPITADFYGDSSLEREISLEQFVSDFTGQLEHVNELILRSFDGILDASDTPPIIIVLSDHGSATETDWRATSWRSADPAAVVERTAILFAALVPGEPAIFPNDVELVHVLPLLFNAQFDASHSLAVPHPGGMQIPWIDPAVLRAEP